jgi:hypothetical protein
MKQKIFFAIIACFFVNACVGSVFVDTRRDAGTTKMVGESTPDMVAICYAPSKATKKQIYDLAEKECAKTDRVAKFHHKSDFTCRLTVPNHAYFKCVDPH